MKEMMELIKNYAWALELALLAFFIFFIPLFFKKFFLKFKNKHQLQETDWRYFLAEIINGPIKVIVWILFIGFVFELFLDSIGLSSERFPIAAFRNAAIIGCVTWVSFRWKKTVRKVAMIRRAEGKPTLRLESIEMFDKFFTIVVFFISSLLILQILGFNIGPLMTFGGIGAAALGFASKDTIANLYGGMIIHMTRPFFTHDLIEIPEKKIWGVVEEIGWYFTTIRNREKSPMYVPNSIFSTEFVMNLSRMTHRLIEQKIPFSIEDAVHVEELVEKVRQFLHSHPDIDSTQNIYVSMTTFNLNSVGLEIKAYTFKTRYDQFIELKQSVLMKICSLAKEAGVAIRFPKIYTEI